MLPRISSLVEENSPRVLPEGTSALHRTIIRVLKSKLIKGISFIADLLD